MADRRIDVGCAAGATIGWIDTYVGIYGGGDPGILVHAGQVSPASAIALHRVLGVESISVVQDTAIAATSLCEFPASGDCGVLGGEDLVYVEGFEIFRSVRKGERNVETVGGAFGDESCVGDANAESGSEKNELGVHV